MSAVALKDLGLPMTNDGYRYYDKIEFGIANPPERPVPKPPLPGGPGNGGPGNGGPVDPGYGIPETGLPGWTKAAVGPPGKNVPPADIPLATNYAWMLVVYPDKTASWAQVGPHAVLQPT